MDDNNEKVIATIEKISLICKRIVLGIIIIGLLLFILLDTVLLKQTIKAKNYIDATATYVDKSTNEEDSIFDDYLYTFTDKNGKEQEITVSISEDNEPDQEIKIKYNEKNPQDFYEESATLSKNEIIWYIVKVVILVLLIILFFNKKLLNKIGISISNN